MGKIVNFGVAPPHDPMFGISGAYIVPHLTRNNWRTKATGRVTEGQFLYVMVKRGELTLNGRKQTKYFVRVHFLSPTGHDLNAEFDKLVDALAYANGEDKSVMALSTEPAALNEYPDDRGADFFITGFTGQGRERRPNFTIRVPCKN